MKTILAILVMTILATGVISPALQDAFAAKADNSEKLSPKSFGDKTKKKMPKESPKSHKIGFDTVKPEQAKSFKKLIAANNATQSFKNIYKIG
ncbi:MAG: hypothetical protein ACW9W3_05700 [Candidatus Nitrosopumilus sp. bin_68KS]